MAQPLRIKTAAFPASDLLLESFACNQALSRLGEISVSLLSPNSELDVNKILGQTVTIEIELRDDKKRHLHGFVTRFSQTGASTRFHRYQAVVRPWLWFLTRTTDCRIFQNLTVPQIVKAVFDDHPVAVHEFKTFREYAVREYCVQYRESDFNFVSRLLEQEGIYYRFDHTDGEHKLILLDSLSAHDPQPDGADDLPFSPAAGQFSPDRDVVTRWAMSRSAQPGRFATRDFDFELPTSDLLVSNERQREHDLSDGELFDYPGGYKKKPDGTQYLEDRRDEVQSKFEVFNATSNSRVLRPGFTVRLRNHARADQNAEYLVTETSLQGNSGSNDAGDGVEPGFSCEFKSLSSAQQFRPPRAAQRPVVSGPQTAMVVGKEGEEIHTDKFGRVRVQFHWDRLGKKNEKSSCMMRVAQVWAGKSFGAMFIPRVGHEVIVDFLEGDPDRPIITGCVYNGDNLPPWALPDNATQSGVLTRSSKGGAVANANMIRFEDKKGSEQLAVHAERNLDTSVEADETHTVGHDRTKTIDNDEKNEIKNNRSKVVGVDETVTIGANRLEKVGADETISVGGNRTETVTGNETLSVTGNRSDTITGSETVSITGSRSLTVSAAETVKIAAARSETIGADLSQKVGGAYSQTVASGISITTPGAFKVQAAGGVTFIAPGGTKFVDWQFEKLGSQNMATYGINIEGYSLHNETSLIATAQKGVSIEASGIKTSHAQMMTTAIAMKMVSHSAKLENAAVFIGKAGMRIFS